MLLIFQRDLGNLVRKGIASVRRIHTGLKAKVI